jgi:hypothetical protein
LCFGVGAFSWEIVGVRGATQVLYFNSYLSADVNAVDMIIANEALGFERLATIVSRQR